MTSLAYEALLSIGDITFRIVADDPRLASIGGDALEPFVAGPRRNHQGRSRTDVEVEVSARWVEAPTRSERRGQLLFDSAGSWQLRQSGSDFLFTFRSAVSGQTAYKTARFNPTFTEGDVELSRRYFDGHSSAAVYPLEYPLDELLMIHLLAQGRGVEIHACGVVDEAGRAHLFAGQSGAGKSTMARLWLNQPGVSLISDERVVLRTDRNRIMAFGTPWHGDAMLVSPRSGELATVFFLNQGASHRVTQVGRSQAAARLFACSFLPFHNVEAIDQTMTALERVTREAWCHDLWFAPDPSVIDVVTRHMG